MRASFVCLSLSVLLAVGCERASIQHAERRKPDSAVQHAEPTRPAIVTPFVAIWSKYLRVGIGDSGYLRVAIWDDGRIQFAQDPKTGNYNLRQGRIDPAQVAALKAALVNTGVFDLKGTCYLVPDAPCICMTLNLGDKQQMLYWDEREMPGYGISFSPKPRHQAFMRCWKEVNRLAIQAIPDQSVPLEERFQPPQSWYLKRPIQSE
jgi:hypothetical protein